MAGKLTPTTKTRGRVSWFGGPNDNSDSGRTALGLTTNTPGVAIRPGATYESGRPTLGGYWKIKDPKTGKSYVLRQTDIGPNQSTGRRIDLTYSALKKFGYSEKNFPTDAQWSATYLGKNRPKGSASSSSSADTSPTTPAATDGGSTAVGNDDARKALVMQYLQRRRFGNSGSNLTTLAAGLQSLKAAEPVATASASTALSSKAKKSSPAEPVRPDGWPVKPKGLSGIKELFYDPQGGWKGTTPIGPIGGHSDHVHVAAGPKTTVVLGRLAQKMGLHVGENPHFGGVAPVHVANSNHYKNEAIDVSGATSLMAKFARRVRQLYGLK